ncbi:MAG: vWA domain-containing protein, partial [Terriglobales bacterium]
YVQSAFAQRHPIGDAITAAQNFFTIMNNDADVHFGLVTFGQKPGTTATSTAPSDYGYSTIGSITNVPSAYVSNGTPSDPLSPAPPNPGIDLNPNAGPSYSNYSAVSSGLTPLVAYGGTDIAGALNASLKMLRTTAQGGRGLSRIGAQKAVVLFTDGLPTISSLGGDATADARSQASLAHQYGIPIYCIGLCMVNSLQSSQTTILTDQNSNAGTGGIAGISGCGAAFFQGTKASQLNLIFENVARSLVQLVR